MLSSTLSGDPTRLALVERMTRGEHTLGELAEPFAISLQAVQKHLRVLQEAGLVATRKQGQRAPLPQPRWTRLAEGGLRSKRGAGCGNDGWNR